MGNIVYLSHGGGPLPILGDPSHQKMVSFLRELPKNIERPDSVVVISAHWEEYIPTITGAEKPALIYDYYGFPEAAYKVEYPARGNPALARRVSDLLKRSDIMADIDTDRGFDHGLFIPLKIMYPEPSIPMIQISLVKGLDPGKHIGIGIALQELAKENILIIGSGFSFHNMAKFDWKGKNQKDRENDVFQDWLIELFSGYHNRNEIENKLLHWENAPGGRYCHPREEHLIPLAVCFGASDSKSRIVFDDYILGKRSIAVQW